MKNSKGSRRRWATKLALAVALLVGASAHAAERGSLFVRIDNDLFTSTDREYTNGI